MQDTTFLNHSGREKIPCLIELPQAPRNASPLPWLTSIHGVRPRGPYGDRRYRGNCGGYLIRDLLQYFGAKRVLDPMTGGGACRDVCRELEIPCHSFDLHGGRDAADPASYEQLGLFDFIWLHPPYWRMIRYGDDPNCLSSAASLAEFLDRLQAVIRNCRGVLAPEGKLAILIGGYSERGRYLPLAYYAMSRALQEGLWPACVEIVRLQHGNTSSHKTYASRFIPGLHDMCLVFEHK